MTSQPRKCCVTVLPLLVEFDFVSVQCPQIRQSQEFEKEFDLQQALYDHQLGPLGSVLRAINQDADSLVDCVLKAEPCFFESRKQQRLHFL